MTRAAALAIDGGDLTLSSGLTALLRPALELVEPGGVIAILSSAPSLRHDLGSFCRVERHVYLGCEQATTGRDRHLVARGELAIPRGTDLHMPDRADPATGFAPRGARVEPGGPIYPFTLVERDRVVAPEVDKLTQQAVAAQWDANRDIPWGELPELAPPVEAAVAQVFSFLAENELSALYVPARFIPRLHPAYIEVGLFLATQLADEARHIDGFLRRARARGGVGAISSATTARSLHFLLSLEDFTEAAFLLSVQGEGTFLDLLRFIEEHAPDGVTRELARRARVDETRHVHFGLAHVRHAIAHDPALADRLAAAVLRRSATIPASTAVPAPIADALTILAAGSTEPRAVARGHEAFRELLGTMHANRKKRLAHAGFASDEADRISGLHTPNFM